MTDAELAALARNAIYDRDHRPAKRIYLTQYANVWSPERALAALAVIAAARGAADICGHWSLNDALATWDALP